jgi:hypothetical protein
MAAKKFCGITQPASLILEEAGRDAGARLRMTDFWSDDPLEEIRSSLPGAPGTVLSTGRNWDARPALFSKPF